MARRTISIPDGLARAIEGVARKERRSFSAAVASLVDEALRRRRSAYAFIGAGESKFDDLGSDAERHLREVAGDRD